jgi:hypothetical protein
MSTKHHETASFWRSPIGLVLCGFLAIAALLIALEHQAHLLGLWPLLFLLMCAGMHFLMHRGQGGRGAHGRGYQSHTNRRGDNER